MKRVLSIIVLSVLILLVFTTIGCSRATRIVDILANPSQYEGKDLTIRGAVGESAWFALVGKGTYQLVMGIISLIFGVIVMIPPKILNYLIGVYLIIIGIWAIIQAFLGPKVSLAGANKPTGREISS